MFADVFSDLHWCWLSDVRGWLAETFGIRRELLMAPTVCPPDCCGHGHIYCRPHRRTEP